MYDEAVKRVTGLKESQAVRPNVQMKLSLDGAPLNGADIKLNLLLKSENSKAQDLTLKMSAQVMRYTGNPAAGVWSHTTDLQLQPNTGTGLVLTTNQRPPAY